MINENPGTVFTITSGASTTLIAGFSISEIGVVIGVVVTTLSFVTTLYFQIKRDRRESLYKKRMRSDSKLREMQQASDRNRGKTPRI